MAKTKKPATHEQFVRRALLGIMAVGLSSLTDKSTKNILVKAFESLSEMDDVITKSEDGSPTTERGHRNVTLD